MFSKNVAKFKTLKESLLTLTEGEDTQFKEELVVQNYNRSKIINLILFIISMILIYSDSIYQEKGLWNSVPGYKYLFYAHSILFVLPIVLFLIDWFFAPRFKRFRNVYVIVFALFITLLCTSISIIDQLIHGEITLYIIGAYTIAVMNSFKPLTSLIIYLINYLVFIIGVTSIQENEAILRGHYTNGTVLLIIAWVLSFILYKTKVRDFFSRITIEHQKVELESANQQLVATNEKLEESLQALDETQNIVFSLADALESKDSYTHGHSARVAETAVELAKYLKLSEADQVNIYRAAILHDLGKIGIPDAILNKPGALTTEEWSIMKSHPERGEAICSKLNFAKEILPTIRHHHERYDGKGYPDGLEGEGIPFLARLVSVADTVDAMTSYRPYRPAVAFEKVLEELRHCAGKQLDPALVSAYIAMKTNDRSS